MQTFLCTAHSMGQLWFLPAARVAPTENAVFVGGIKFVHEPDISPLRAIQEKFTFDILFYDDELRESARAECAIIGHRYYPVFSENGYEAICEFCRTKGI